MSLVATGGSAALVVGGVISIAITSFFDPMMAWMLIGIWLRFAMAATTVSTKT